MSTFLDLLIILYLIRTWHVKEPQDTREINMQATKDEAVSLYTFYEGRVQTTKSILVGILTGMLSLQTPIFLEHILKKSSFSWIDVTPLIIIATLSIPVFISMQTHMKANAHKSKVFQCYIKGKNIMYNPNYKGRIYSFFQRFSLGLDSILIVAIILLPFISIFFINCPQ
jgi:hypothetical protein